MVLSSGMIIAIVAIAGVAVAGAVFAWKRALPGKIKWPVTAVGGLLGLGAAIVLMGASHLVRVGADMQISTARLLGSTTVSIDGHDVDISSHGSGVTVIVNESSRELAVQTLVYGELSPGAMVPPDATIAPH